MKNVMIGICSCVLIGILILTVYTLHGRSSRKAELETALASSMRTTMEELQSAEMSRADSSNREERDGIVSEETESNRISSNEELTAVFLQNFLLQINSNSKVSVHILDVDYEKGLLSVEAVSEYVHPVGLKGTVSARQTVILEKYRLKEQPEYCCIQYMAAEKSYKTYYIQKGKGLILPKEPESEGKTFVGWYNLENQEIAELEGKIVTKDDTYVAMYE